MIEIKEHLNKGHNKHYTDGEFFYQPIVDGKEYSFIAETWDMAMLIGLAIKHDGVNSQFPKFAARALNIDSEWAK